MKRIIQIGITFMRSSKMLTFSAFLSIFVACFLSISMFQLSSNVKSSIEKGMEAKKGAFDIKVTKNESESFTDEEIKFLKQEKTVKKISRGYQTNELLDTYMVGVADDAINKSLYKYTKDIKGDSIIINDSFGKRENKKTGDTFLIGKKKFNIIQVIKTDSMSDYKMPMVIMELSQIHKLLGHSNLSQVNYMLLQCDDSAYVEVEDKYSLSNRIKAQYPNFYVSDQRGGTEYSAMLKNIQMIFRIFFVVVIMISGLFVVNIFMEYMRKYRKDMAIVRTVGGSQNQVQTIFCSMSIILSAVACLAGAAFSTMVSGVTLQWFNDKVQMFDGNASINWKVLCQITITVFIMFNIFVYVAFYFGQSVLPIQVFNATSSSLKKARKANRFISLRNIFGNSGYLGMKLMASKFRQNFMMILIVVLITALSYTGQASLKLLKANDDWYNYNTVEGKTARIEIESDKNMSLSYIKKLYKRFETVIGNGYMLYGDFDLISNNEENETMYSFKVSDLETLPHLLHAEIWKQYKNVPKTKRIVMEESVASEKGYQLGDTVTLESDFLEGKKDFILVEIVGADTLYAEMYKVIVDWDNLCEKKESAEGLDGPSVGIWLDGDKELIREKFQQLQLEMDTNLEWKIYDDVVENSKHMVSQWITTLHVVLAMLLIVAGIGLLNSANGMLLARKKEYRALRMLGATDKSVHRICWMQTWSYMLSGVILGAITGAVIVVCLWKNNVITNTPITVDWEYIAVIAIYLFGLSLTLYPTVKKMGR